MSVLINSSPSKLLSLRRTPHFRLSFLMSRCLKNHPRSRLIHPLSIFDVRIHCVRYLCLFSLNSILPSKCPSRRSVFKIPHFVSFLCCTYPKPRKSLYSGHKPHIPLHLKSHLLFFTRLSH